MGPPLILLGNWAHLGLSRPCPAPIRSIPEIFIKNILHSDIFPGHSSSLMTLVVSKLGSEIGSEQGSSIVNTEKVVLINVLMIFIIFFR